MNIKQLNELMGITINQTPLPRDQQQTQNAVLTVKHCASLRGWQQTVVNRLGRSNQPGREDQFVIASPGGGKTLPFICWWLQNVLGLQLLSQSNPNQLIINLNNLLISPNKLQKIVILVPTRTLAQQTTQEFREVFATVLSQLINWLFNNYRIEQQARTPMGTFEPGNKQIRSEIGNFLHNNFNMWMKNNGSHNFQVLIHQFDELSLELEEINREIGNTGFQNRQAEQLAQRRLDQHISNITTEVENVCINFINTKLLCIRTGGENLSSPKQAAVTIAVYASASNGRILREIGSQTDLIVLDEAHQTQPLISKDSDYNKDYEEKAQSLYSILLDLESVKSNAALIMLSGTQNPASAKTFCEYLNVHFGRNFNINNIQVTGDRNQAQIEVIPDDSLSNDNGIVRSIINDVRSKAWGNLYVLFGINKMGNLIEKCFKQLGFKNTANIGSNTQYRPSFQQSYRPNTLRSRIQQINIDQNRITTHRIADNQMGNFVNNDARNIRDPFLRLAVSHGIGFIGRFMPPKPAELRDPKAQLDNKGREMMSEDDKAIISELFKNKKIPVLIATDAVGIGVNIDVRRLYLPSVQKFTGVKMEDIILRDLAQILNRAGRSATPFASIHTPQHNVELVMKALVTSPVNFDETSVAKSTKKTINSFKILYTRTHMSSQDLMRRNAATAGTMAGKIFSRYF